MEGFLHGIRNNTLYWISNSIFNIIQYPVLRSLCMLGMLTVQNLFEICKPDNNDFLLEGF